MEIISATIAVWIATAIGFAFGYKIRGIRASRDIARIIKWKEEKDARSNY